MKATAYDRPGHPVRACRGVRASQCGNPLRAGAWCHPTLACFPASVRAASETGVLPGGRQCRMSTACQPLGWTLDTLILSDPEFPSPFRDEGS